MHFKTPQTIYKDITYNLPTLSQINNNYNSVYEISLFRTAPYEKFSLSEGRSFQPKKYILGLRQSMTEDKELLIVMHSPHFQVVKSTKLEAEHSSSPAYEGKTL